MPSVSSWPSAHTRSPSIRSFVDSASRVTASESWGSMLRCMARRVMARYINPLSMKGRPSLSATRFPTADLPDATPPSMVTITRRRILPHGAAGVARSSRRSHHLDLGWSGWSVVQLHPRAKRIELLGSGRSRDRDHVLLGDLVARMGQSVGDIPIVGQQEQPGAV